MYLSSNSPMAQHGKQCRAVVGFDSSTLDLLCGVALFRSEDQRRSEPATAFARRNALGGN